MRSSALGNAILKVSKSHEQNLVLVDKLRGNAQGAREALKARFPKSKVLPPFFAPFIRGLRPFDKEVVYPAIANPHLDIIGIMDNTVTEETAEEHVRWLMYQQICRLVLAASHMGWDYTDKKLLPLLERRTELLVDFMDGRLAKLEEMPLYQMVEFAQKKTVHENNILESIVSQKQIKKIVVDYLISLPKNSREALLAGFGLAHYWEIMWRRSNYIKEESVRSFCIAVAAKLCNIDVEAPFEVFSYIPQAREMTGRKMGEKETQEMAMSRFQRMVIRIGHKLTENTINNLFAGKTNYNTIRALASDT